MIVYWIAGYDLGQVNYLNYYYQSCNKWRKVLRSAVGRYTYKPGGSEFGFAMIVGRCRTSKCQLVCSGTATASNTNLRRRPAAPNTKEYPPQ